MTLLSAYRHFSGLTWNMGFLTNLLAYQGITAPHTGEPLTEALLSGINGGICAGYFVFEYEGQDPHLHFLTRYPFNENTPDVVYDRLGIVHTVQQTTNPQKAAANILNALARGKPVTVWADVVSLPYTRMDGVGDYWLVSPVLVYGLDLMIGEAHLADRAQVPHVVSTEDLERARARIKKTRFRQMTVDSVNLQRLPEAVRAGIQSCVALYDGIGAPGMPGNFGFNAFQKWARALEDQRGAKSWAKQFAPGRRMYAGLTSAYRYLEVWFTGGSGARGEYADFLDEAAVILQKPALHEVAGIYRRAAAQWQALSLALLPDEIAPLRETRTLLKRNYTLFLTQGGASGAERDAIQERLAQIRAQMATDFPLDDTEAAAFRARLRAQVLAIHAIERQAVDQLTAIMAD